jgi:hypothetical protein
VGRPQEIATLPSHVVAPEEELTLFADFGDPRDNGLVLYLVNRTHHPVRFDAQDDDIYVKLEFKQDDGTWTRAQTHQYSWCGNSYMHAPELHPGHYYRFLGYLPSNGELREIRYRRYAGTVDLVSNTGRGYVSLAEVAVAATDRLAINTGDLEFLRKIATGEITLPKARNDWIDPREAAIYALAQERFKREEVIPVLRLLIESGQEEVAERAENTLKRINRRDNNAMDSDKK